MIKQTILISTGNKLKFKEIVMTQGYLEPFDFYRAVVIY